MFSKGKDRLFATFLLLCLFPILFICFLFYEQAQKAVFEHYETSVGEHLKLADERLALFLRMAQGEVNDLAENPVLLMAEGKGGAILSRGRPQEAMSMETMAVREMLLQFSRRHMMIGNIHLLRDDGSILSMRLESRWTGDPAHHIRLHNEGMGQGQGVWLVSRENEQDHRKSMYMAQRVKNMSGESVGILLVELRLDQLADWIKTSFTSRENELMMISPSGKILLHTDVDKIGKNMAELPDYEGIRKWLKNPTGDSMFSFHIHGKTAYAFHQLSSASGNMYVELLSGEEISHHLDRLDLFLLVASLLIVVFSAYVSHQLTRWIGKPIYTLVSATDSLLHGDFSIRVPIQGMEEITLLEKKFNQMAEQLHTLIGREREYLQKGLDQIVRSFYLAVEMKDPYTAGHTERVTEYALIIYDHLEHEYKQTFSRDDLRYAGLMHDIGKVAIPDDVLLKDGKLTDEEYERIKLHPSIGADIVEQIESLAHVSPGVRHHHERWDGRGYPDQLRGEEIPLIGRILAVADTFDAMASTRSYRKAMTAQEAYEEILRCSHTQFDPYIVAIFKEAYQDGSIHVKLPEDKEFIGEKEAVLTASNRL